MRDSKAEYQFIDFAKRSRNLEPPADSCEEHCEKRARPDLGAYLALAVAFGTYIGIAWACGWLR
jgi:hypothetical protein